MKLDTGNKSPIAAREIEISTQNSHAEQDKVDVAIILGNYNSFPYIQEAIKSVLDSSVLPFELIVVDDGSTDESLDYLKEIVPSLCDRKMRYVFLTIPHSGLASALNRAIEEVTTTYSMRMDSDDLLHPEKIRLQYKYMVSKPDLGATGTNCFHIDETGRIIGNTNFMHSHKDIIKAYRRGDHGLLHATIMIKSSILKENKYIPDSFPAEDYALYGKLVSGGIYCENLQRQLYFVRIGKITVSSGLKRETIIRTFYYRDCYFRGYDRPFHDYKKNLSIIKNIQIFIEYTVVRSWRKYLRYRAGGSHITAFLYLAISALLRPRKAFNRFFR